MVKKTGTGQTGCKHAFGKMSLGGSAWLGEGKKPYHVASHFGEDVKWPCRCCDGKGGSHDTHNACLLPGFICNSRKVHLQNTTSKECEAVCNAMGLARCEQNSIKISHDMFMVGHVFHGWNWCNGGHPCIEYSTMGHHDISPIHFSGGNVTQRCVMKKRKLRGWYSWSLRQSKW